MVQTALRTVGKRRPRPQNLKMRFRLFLLLPAVFAVSCQHKSAPPASAKDAGVASALSQGLMSRGRPERAEILVIADQFSKDDAQTGRALSGIEGERLQGFLSGLGAGPNYFIVRTLTEDSLGKDPREIQKLLDQSRSRRNAAVADLLAANPGLKMVLTLGAQADQEIKTMELGTVPAISLTGPGGYQRAFESIRHLTAWGKNRRMMLTLKPVPLPAADLPEGYSSPATAVAESARKPAASKRGSKRAPASMAAPVEASVPAEASRR